MNYDGSTAKRLSLSVPGTSELDDNETPTIDQLLAETSVNQPITISTSYLTVNSNVSHSTIPQHLGRS